MFRMTANHFLDVIVLTSQNLHNVIIREITFIIVNYFFVWLGFIFNIVYFWKNLFTIKPIDNFARNHAFFICSTRTFWHGGNRFGSAYVTESRGSPFFFGLHYFSKFKANISRIFLCFLYLYIWQTNSSVALMVKAVISASPKF